MKNWIFSTVRYTTGETVSTTPMSTRTPIVIYGTASSKKPSAKLKVVVPPVAHPGQAHGTTVMMMNSQPQCLHNRVKPVTAVSPVARV